MAADQSGTYRYVLLEDIPAFLERGWVLDRPASLHSVFMWAPEDTEDVPSVAADPRDAETAAT